MKKTVLILAKSNKRRNNGSYGKCVAGVELINGRPGKWIRLVADEDGDSIAEADCSFFTPLDILEVNCYPCPLNNQIENYTYSYWRKVDRLRSSQLDSIYSGISHSFFGKMETHFDGQPTNSLTILQAHDIHIYWEELNGKFYQKASFYFFKNYISGVSMTDPEHYTNKANRETKDIKSAYMVISLPASPSYDSLYPKYIASIFEI